MSAREVIKDLYNVGGNDFKAQKFENFYPLPDGMSFNSYVLVDDKTVLLDTVEMPLPENNVCECEKVTESISSPYAPFSQEFYRADPKVYEAFIQGVKEALNGRKLDYIIVHHMEPDHSQALIKALFVFPEAKIIISAQGKKILDEYLPGVSFDRFIIAAPDYRLNTGHHIFRFIPAPMVHWPEVMFSYEEKEQILFSADAFGTFGANHAMFADEVKKDDYFYSEMRRYYTNIVGKFGAQVLKALGSVQGLPIKMICPLHGLIWRRDFEQILDRYTKWASYEPEDPHSFIVLIGTVYGHTSLAASHLDDLIKGGRYYDVTKTDASYLISEAFRVKTIVLASVTHAGSLYPPMEAFLEELVHIGLPKRNYGLIENGSWAPMAAKRMKELLGQLKDSPILEPTVTIHGAYNPLTDEESLKALANAIKKSIE